MLNLNFVSIRKIDDHDDMMFYFQRKKMSLGCLNSSIIFGWCSLLPHKTVLIYFFPAPFNCSLFGLFSCWRNCYGKRQTLSDLSDYTQPVNSWFSHDVTKIHSYSKLSIRLRFYFHDLLEQLKTNIHTNFLLKGSWFCDIVRLNF